MTRSRDLNNKLMICSGPGCKAWDSEKVINLVRNSIEENQNFQPCTMDCVNNCGGGVSIGMSNSGKIVKLRVPSDIFSLLKENNGSS
jgi:hypothetical protein